MTALHHATARGHSIVVAGLLADRRLTTNIVDNSGNTALHWAVNGRHTAVIGQLLSSVPSIDPNAADTVRHLLLNLTISNTHALLQTHMRRTALHLAVDMHHLPSVVALIPHSDINVGDHVQTPTLCPTMHHA